MQRISLFLLLALLFTPSLHAQLLTDSFPKRETRAVWMTTIGGLDWPHSYAQSPSSAKKQQAEFCRLLDSYRQAGINTVLLQTRIRGTVIYSSAMEPWDGCLSGIPGRSPGYDALRFAIDECHKRGLELHAWVVTIPVGKWGKLGCASLRKRLPKVIRKIGPDGYMDPESPLTARYLATLCAEITRNYDIDGIHLDYIRYPETWRIRVSHDQGRACVTAIARAIHDSVKSIKPWVKLSASPVGKAQDLSRFWSHGWNAYEAVCQDAQGWLKEGLMDELYPMMYFRDNQFFPFAIDWAEQREGRNVAPGLGIYFLDPREGKWRLNDVSREMHQLRAIGLGHAYFRGKFLTDNTQGILDFARAFDAYPALPPAMRGAPVPPPAPPTHISLAEDSLTWEGDAPLYNVYSSRSWPVDASDARNLVAARLTTPGIAVETEGRYFAVAAMDRFGNESQAVQSYKKPLVKPTAMKLLRVDGHTVALPDLGAVLDKRLVVIETLQGTLMSTRPYSRRLDINGLRPGYYVVRSLGRKGVTHRLGWIRVPPTESAKP